MFIIKYAAAILSNVKQCNKPYYFYDITDSHLVHLLCLRSRPTEYYTTIISHSECDEFLFKYSLNSLLKYLLHNHGHIMYVTCADQYLEYRKK